MSCELGLAWFGQTNVSSLPKEMLATSVESNAAIEIVYGFSPPLTCTSNGSHVWRVSDVDTFGDSVILAGGDEGRQPDVPLPSEDTCVSQTTRGVERYEPVTE